MTVAPVARASQPSNIFHSTAQTRPISNSVGSTLNSRKVSRVWMPLVPRSMARVRPPVWRAR
ncbi:Uncharacterised protein [Bordetella pertussis]|nr:Uncharacterised protein [Bordetella pertussis]CFW36868.1 Uncharacterised protein [Bordetella pertussis]